MSIVTKIFWGISLVTSTHFPRLSESFVLNWAWTQECTHSSRKNQRKKNKKEWIDRNVRWDVPLLVSTITCKMAVPPELPRIYTWFRFFNRLFAELPLVKSDQWVRMGEIEKKEVNNGRLICIILSKIKQRSHQNNTIKHPLFLSLPFPSLPLLLSPTRSLVRLFPGNLNCVRGGREYD